MLIKNNNMTHLENEDSEALDEKDDLICDDSDDELDEILILGMWILVI